MQLVLWISIAMLMAPWGVSGMAELNAEMLQARNLEELLAAERQPEEHRRRMRRQMQDLPDSVPILADMFDGTPGFYHGVASGK